ncbi:MAG: S1C family serine protease [Minwuia sp.]|uniref:S1C family serine protease n=1 Tax=Minwuia sp. TaxID=2493630 RepID=UPI003A8B4ADD
MADDDETGEEKGFKVNGHKLPNLTALFGSGPAAAAAAVTPAENDDLPFDVEAVHRALTPLQAEIPEDAFTAPLLGTERAGGGIVIGAGGLILTIGYLIVEAESVAVLDSEGRPTEADVLAYDFESGFGLVRAVSPLNRPMLNFGTVRDLKVGSSVVTSCGGAETIVQTVTGKRPFQGYWEYALDEAIYTAPAHPNWGGAAMIGMDGLLYGVGSLYIEDATAGGKPRPGNMIVPIDLLEPILNDLIIKGRRNAPPRPWLGLFADERMGHVVVLGTSPSGPAAHSGLEQGDIILRVNGVAVGSLAEFYEQLWSAGPAGSDIALTLMRQDAGSSFETSIRSADRDSYLKIQRWQK